MEEKQNTQVFFYLNAFFQLGAIIAFQHLGILWPIYVVMGMLCIVIALQTLGAAISFSGASLTDKVTVSSTSGINVLISILYLMSSYNVYLIGFVGFAWVAATHSVIHLLTNTIGATKK